MKLLFLLFLNEPVCWSLSSQACRPVIASNNISYLVRLKGWVYYFFHFSTNGRISSLAMISSERASFKLAILDKMAAQQMTSPQKIQRTMALEQFLEKIIEVAVRKIQAPTKTEITWMTFSIIRRLDVCSSPSQNTMMLQVSRCMREQKQRNPNMWIKGHDTEQISTIASTTNANEQAYPSLQLSFLPQRALLLTFVTLSYHRLDSQQSRKSYPGLVRVVKKLTAVWLRMKIQQKSPSACLQIKENSSIHPQPVFSNPSTFKVSLTIDPRITLMMRQAIVILNSFIDHQLRRVFFSHSTILLIRNRIRLFRQSKMAGPMIVGILKYVSVEVNAMKKKLISSSRKQTKLKMIKFMSSFLCSPMFTHIKSLGSWAHLTIILESATFQVASSLTQPKSGQIVHKAFPIQNSLHSLSAVSMRETMSMQLLILLRSRQVSAIFFWICKYSYFFFSSIDSQVSYLKNLQIQLRLETPQFEMTLVISSRYSSSRRSWYEGTACTAIIRSSCCISSTRYCCICDLMEAQSIK